MKQVNENLPVKITAEKVTFVDTQSGGMKRSALLNGLGAVVKSTGYSKVPIGVKVNGCLSLCEPCNRLATSHFSRKKSAGIGSSSPVTFNV